MSRTSQQPQNSPALPQPHQYSPQKTRLRMVQPKSAPIASKIESASRCCVVSQRPNGQCNVFRDSAIGKISHNSLKSSLHYLHSKRITRRSFDKKRRCSKPRGQYGCAAKWAPNRSSHLAASTVCVASTLQELDSRGKQRRTIQRNIILAAGEVPPKKSGTMYNKLSLMSLSLSPRHEGKQAPHFCTRVAWLNVDRLPCNVNPGLITPWLINRGCPLLAGIQTTFGGNTLIMGRVY